MSLLHITLGVQQGHEAHQQTNKHMQNTTRIIEVPAHVWHKTASAIVAAGLSIGNGFFQCQASDGNVWTFSLFVPAIFAGDVILTPSQAS